MITAQCDLCSAIEIYGWVGMSLTDGKDMGMPEFIPFRDHVVELMGALASTKSGRILFQNLEATNKTVRVHYGADFQDNACRMDPNTADNGKNACVRSFRPAHHNVSIGLKGTEKSWRGLNPGDDRSAQKANVKNQVAGYGMAVRKSETAPVLECRTRARPDGEHADPAVVEHSFRETEGAAAKAAEPDIGRLQRHV